MSADYRIEFTVKRRRQGESDFAEVGFGSSGTWTHPEQAAHIVNSIVNSMVQDREWETGGDMPDPVDA